MHDNIHVIRLRGPWHYAVLARSVIEPDGTIAEAYDQLPEPGTVTMPTDWGASLGEDFRGRVRYERSFGKPTGLTKDDSVALVVDRIRGTGRVWLNEALLGEIRPQRHDWHFFIHDRLQPRNRLEIEVSLPQQTSNQDADGGDERLAGGLIGDVYLKIIHPTES